MDSDDRPTSSQPFPTIEFRGELRPSQRDVVEIAERKLARRERTLHVVAPPGSGKTVLGLYLWAEVVRRPALVLSPNSAIQAQWAARTDLFDVPGGQRISTNPREPGLLTSLTYQSVTLPMRASESLDARANGRWIDRLVENGEADDPEEAAVWIDDLQRHNPGYHDERLAAYRKEVRDEQSRGGDSLELLHEGSRETLTRLRDAAVGLIILDECHHLLGHWGRILADAHDFLNGPVVIGLTATPPDIDSKDGVDGERYREFFGPIDYEVPVPGVVKDGFLAPYQDLAYVVRPDDAELRFVARADEQLHAIVDSLCEPPEQETATSPEPDDEGVADGTLTGWLLRTLAERRLPTGTVDEWTEFERRDPSLAEHGRLFLLRRDEPLPEEVPELVLSPRELEDVDEMTYLPTVLDRYVRHRLRRSPNEADHHLAGEIATRLRLLGWQVTETGTRPCLSPVGRVLAFSRAKTRAPVRILRRESEVLGDRLRAIVVADFEKTSSISTEVAHLLDAESGGAVAAFRALLSDPVTDELDPILVTGASVLVDDDAAARFDDEARRWFAERGYQVELVLGVEDGFHVVTGRGRDWSPRHYVEMITDLFQRGITRCLVGTRGLLGEGWDANKVNVLVDLTTVTTSMSFNQLRGRSIRIDPDEPEKVANNWDVVCIAPEFTKGLDDYRRFTRKHATTFGVTDDGVVERGVGHVHAAFTEIRPELLDGSVAALNEEMLVRAGRRAEARAAWRIGEPYEGTAVRTVECRAPAADREEWPPFRGAQEPWSDHSLTIAVGRAVYFALCDAKLVSGGNLRFGDRAGGFVRMFLESADAADSRLFAEAVGEVLGPLVKPRYVIPRAVEIRRETWLSWLLPSVVGRFFRERARETVMLHGVPTILARNRDLVAHFEKRWNEFVSPGIAVYAHRGTGSKLVESARRDGLLPRGHVVAKDVFR